LLFGGLARPASSVFCRDLLSDNAYHLALQAGKRMLSHEFLRSRGSHVHVLDDVRVRADFLLKHG
jgi:hypothetical protein